VVQNAEYVRAYAGRYRDMFPVRILSVAGVAAIVLWLLDWTWTAAFLVPQFGLYVLLWRLVERARLNPDTPGAGARLKWGTEAITFALASHVALFVLVAWRFEPLYLKHLLLLIGGNLMVGALQVHVSRLSFAAAVVPPAATIGVIAWTEAGWDSVLLTSAALFVLGVVGSAWRQARSDRQTVELYVDLAERSKALGVALDAAEAERAAAERANQAKSRFLAVISHEVRTPLNVILGIAEVLKGRRRPKAEAALVGDMADAGGMLLRLLNGALDLSKIESGQTEARLEPVDLGETVAAIARVWRVRVAELGLTLEIERDGRPEDFAVRTDGAKVEQILINFLSNALKLTPSGTIRLAARARPSADGRVDLTFEVHDEGPGVPEDQRERIFQPFEQLAEGRAAGGAGLGLAICRASVEALGGRIGVRPAQPRGSVFWFEIAAERAAVPAAPTPEAVFIGSGRLSVLAAEDHPANRKLLGLLLDRFEADLTLVENGAEAVQAARSGGFDLILMDVMMPVMDGVAALQAIRAEEAAEGRPRVPVRMLTANVFDEDVARYRAAGADGVLRKPIEIEALHRALAETAAGAAPDAVSTAAA
jgi:signal transduction histidine kinase/ActR/RegA family two-component response regulator